jgi:hypothetical protein
MQSASGGAGTPPVRHSRIEHITSISWASSPPCDAVDGTIHICLVAAWPLPASQTPGVLAQYDNLKARSGGVVLASTCLLFFYEDPRLALELLQMALRDRGLTLEVKRPLVMRPPSCRCPTGGP